MDERELIREKQHSRVILKKVREVEKDDDRVKKRKAATLSKLKRRRKTGKRLVREGTRD